MASSVVLSHIRSLATIKDREVIGSSSIGIHKPSFLQNPKLFFADSSSSSSSVPRKPKKMAPIRCCYRARKRNPLDDIPKQFREENLKDGLIDNYRNVPDFLYGLSPKQMEVFMTEGSPLQRQPEKVTEETISSAYSYKKNGFKLPSSRYQRGRQRGLKLSLKPMDITANFLSDRVVYVGMPLYPRVVRHIFDQFKYLLWNDDTKPIYVYLNSTGTKSSDESKHISLESEAYVVADLMLGCKVKVGTLNISVAHGQAAMLLSLGAKGHRAILMDASTKLYLPKMSRMLGSSSEIWCEAQALESMTETYLELVALGTDKTIKELRKDLQYSKTFEPQEAIDYGLADRIVQWSLKAREPKKSA